VKKLLLVAAFTAAVPALANARPPLKRAREVANVGGRYTLKWVVSPNQEARGDQKVRNAPETDIRGVSAANDRRRLRIDISLHNPVNKRKKVFYAFKIRYKGGVEDWFAYIPHNNRFIQFTRKRGRITKRKVLRKRKGSDYVQVSSTRIGRKRIRNNLISLFVDKDKHFSRKGRGRRKWVTATFYSGYFVRGSGKLKVADSTRTIRLSYRR
jgi:hypothetical protein